MKRVLFLMFAMALLFTSCMENYSNGERIGTITRFSQKGLIFKSWEAHLNITQTGMNTSGEPFAFSVDNNKSNPDLIATLDSAANLGWKVKVVYHECAMKNITGSRGDTNYFIDKLIVLDRNFTDNLKFNDDVKGKQSGGGKVVDTVYVVIVPKEGVNPKYLK